MNYPSFRLVYFLFCLIFLSGLSCTRTGTFYHFGVSQELARYRNRHIYDVHYDLHFTIPDSEKKPIKGTAHIHFKPLKARHGVILDFQPARENIHLVKVNGQEVNYNYMNGHIYIDANGLVPRQNNIVEVEFTSSDQALNRSQEFMYSLFVPDRASTAFPCFDQPDIKATFNLTLSIPHHWTSLSNGSLQADETDGMIREMSFTLEQPISTYLFAFAAGEFQIESQMHNGRTINMYHRETDKKKLQRNVPIVFDLHFQALSWLEAYTSIPYPYDKFDIVLLPGFQYSGMEHPGAIWYRDSRLLLDENPSITRQISQANLIAHETAHMWFGNLVTMKWFDDVWLKEVFAGLMADKIVSDQFPDVNHQLQFVLSHFPRAYSVDRSLGTHPVQQPLPSLNLAGTLYGPIIYNKAPIVFQQLEKIMGEEPFQHAVREYLATYAHSNATWDQLVKIFDKHSKNHIPAWSKTWISGSGMPVIDYEILQKDNLYEVQIKLLNWSESTKNFPAQYLRSTWVYTDTIMQKEIWFDQSPLRISHSGAAPEMIVLNGFGLGYGYFPFKDKNIDVIKAHPGFLQSENLRASVFINIHETFLNHNLDAETYFDFLLQAIEKENNPLLQNYLLSALNILCVNFLEYEDNSKYSLRVEEALWDKFVHSPPSDKELFFVNWARLSRSMQSLKKMESIYAGQFHLEGFKPGEQIITDLVCEILMRKPDNNLIEKELNRLENVDRKRRFQFLIPALSHDAETRNTFFYSLSDAKNRNPEPWVIDALYYFHHPIHRKSSMHYILASLELLEEIQKTGDIFFPQNWLAATLQNHNSLDVARVVDEFLQSHPQLSEYLRMKIKQSADVLFRKAGMI